MKITSITPYIVHCYRTNWVFVVVETDAGITGYGEGTLEGREPTVAEAIKELNRWLLHQDPMPIARHHHVIRRDCYWISGPVLSTALSAVELALWDIKGKALGMPVYELLGGLINPAVKAYANGWFAGAKEPEQFARLAALAVEKGFKALKWDPFGSVYRSLSTDGIDLAVQNVTAVRRAVGSGIDLLIEGHGRFDIMTACQVGRALQALRPYWFEEPVPPGNAAALRDVRDKCGLPIAAGERAYSLYDCRSLLDAGAVDVLQADVCHVGGLLEMKKIAGMAESMYIPVSPHNPNGPVCHAATLHFAASCTNFLMLEAMMTDVTWRNEVATEHCSFSDGYFYVSDRPGLGVDLHVENFHKYPYAPRDLRHYAGTLTDIRPPDAKVWYQINR